MREQRHTRYTRFSDLPGGGGTIGKGLGVARSTLFTPTHTHTHTQEGRGPEVWEGGKGVPPDWFTHNTIQIWRGKENEQRSNDCQGLDTFTHTHTHTHTQTNKHAQEQITTRKDTSQRGKLGWARAGGGKKEPAFWEWNGRSPGGRNKCTCTGTHCLISLAHAAQFLLTSLHV